MQRHRIGNRQPNGVDLPDPETVHPETVHPEIMVTSRLVQPTGVDRPGVLVIEVVLRLMNVVNC